MIIYTELLKISIILFSDVMTFHLHPRSDSRNWPRSSEWRQIHDMKSNSGGTFHSLEPEFSYQDCLQPIKQRPDYWNNLGSSKNRTANQEEEATEMIEGLIDDSPHIHFHRRFLSGKSRAMWSRIMCAFFPRPNRLYKLETASI